MSGLQADKDMVAGFLDGYDREAVAPSNNRSWSYRWGFANAMRDKGKLPPHRDAKRAERVADYIIKRTFRRFPPFSAVNTPILWEVCT